MVRPLGTKPHLLDGEADLASDILTLIQWCYIHISRLVLWDIGPVPLVIKLKKIELGLRAELKIDTCLPCVSHGIFQKNSGVRVAGFLLIDMHIAEHPDHSAALRSPREDGDGGRIGAQIQMIVTALLEARDLARIYTDAVRERFVKLCRHNGQIFLVAVCVAEHQADELDILLFHKRFYLFR